jgi:hypothetical protein
MRALGARASHRQEQLHHFLAGQIFFSLKDDSAPMQKNKRITIVRDVFSSVPFCPAFP